jgi:hypothetical protein
MYNPVPAVPACAFSTPVETAATVTNMTAATRDAAKRRHRRCVGLDRGGYTTTFDNATTTCTDLPNWWDNGGRTEANKPSNTSRNTRANLDHLATSVNLGRALAQIGRRKQRTTGAVFKVIRP